MADTKLNIIKRLDQAVKKGNENGIIDVIEEAEKHSARSAVPSLLKLLAKDNRIGVKNAAAIALRELREDQAVPLLIKLIRDSRFKDMNGTFVYALQTLNWRKEHGVEVAALLSNPSFEVRLMALQAIEQVADELTDDERASLWVGFMVPLVAGRRVNKEIRETLKAAWELLTDKSLESLAQLVGV